MNTTLTTTVLASLLWVVPCFAQSATKATVGELAMHRIEKLVQLKKIDVGYLTNFESLEVMAMPQNNPQDPAFMTMVSQSDGGTATPPQMNLYSAANGRVLSYNVTSGVAGRGLNWPGQDPLSIGEAAFHYIEANSGQVAALAPFDDGFKAITVSQEARSGQTVAIDKLTSSESTKILEFVVGLSDGVVQSWTLIDPAERSN